VHIAIVDQSSYEANFTALKNAGCSVHTYADTTNGFYVHAKAVVADYGLSTQSVYMGSINYSNASMNNNRELGIYITDPTSITQINTTMTADYAGGTAW
jgi:phosphatidylserine/phosphatidylglycerophosphate/cardiolipin synthase-like enzyme